MKYGFGWGKNGMFGIFRREEKPSKTLAAKPDPLTLDDVLVREQLRRNAEYSKKTEAALRAAKPTGAMAKRPDETAKQLYDRTLEAYKADSAYHAKVNAAVQQAAAKSAIEAITSTKAQMEAKLTQETLLQLRSQFTAASPLNQNLHSPLQSPFPGMLKNIPPTAEEAEEMELLALRKTIKQCCYFLAHHFHRKMEATYEEEVWTIDDQYIVGSKRLLSAARSWESRAQLYSDLLTGHHDIKPIVRKAGAPARWKAAV